jgi:carboxypeptidase Taq
MSSSPAYDELVKLVTDAAVLGSCGSLLSWDERTHLPPRGAEFRGEQMALLARLGHEWITHPRIGELLAALGAASDEPVRAANVREIRRGYDRAVKMPARLVEELARVTTQAQSVWVEARKNSDFAHFRPWLERIVALKREEAQAVGFKESPYDALLDEFEPGATAAQIKALFAGLRQELTPLIAAIASSARKPKTDILEREYPVAQQEAFAKEAARAVGFDFDAGRLDVTTHPFCSGIGPGDCRITTRYNPRFFNEAFFGVLHEVGHGLYEQGLPAHHFGLAAGSHCSLGLHESQSRFWENQVGRGRAFWEHFFPKAQGAFPALRDVLLDEWHFAINEVKPSFIRVEADEATYNLHVILRFELEEALVRGDLPVSEVPTAWNEKFRASFAMTPSSDALGCLQDIHWSCGGIGYFPTYTLGNLYAAQWMETIRKDLGDVDLDFRRGQFTRVLGWLREKIHKAARIYPASVLCERVTGQALSTQPLMRHLRGKYTALYGI